MNKIQRAQALTGRMMMAGQLKYHPGNQTHLRMKDGVKLHPVRVVREATLVEFVKWLVAAGFFENEAVASEAVRGNQFFYEVEGD